MACVHGDTAVVTDGAGDVYVFAPEAFAEALGDPGDRVVERRLASLGLELEFGESEEAPLVRGGEPTAPY